jgi:arylsulfatase A-like enzyme
MKRILKLLPFTALALLCSCVQQAETIETPPNVIIVLTDDQGYSDVGFNGNPLVKTPLLDQFASESVIFDKFYANPVCSPTRAALMTGRYAYRTGVLETQEGVSILRPAELTIAEALKEAGYATGMFGKWHLGDNAPARPMDQGFDQTLMHIGGMIGAPYSPLDAQSYFDPVLIDNGVEKRIKGYCADIFTDAAIEFIKDSKDTPFFVYLALNTPHHPLTVGDSYAQPYRDAGLSEETSRYYGMISNIDDNFGRVVQTLKAKGIDDNTIIVFLGDNGTSSLHKQDDLWEVGLRGRKTYVYENGIRVPMFIHLPESKLNGKRLDAVACVEDLMPTILDACKVKSTSVMDGISLLPILENTTSVLPPRSIFAQFHRGQPPIAYRNATVIDGHWKMVQAVGRGGESYSLDIAQFELYNLESDPNEEHDVVNANPEVFSKLKGTYDHWFQDVCSEGFEPVRTWIGSDVENPVMLSRQDWRGGGLFDGDLGHYLLDVKKTGNYTITCRWSKLLKKEHKVVLMLNDRIIENHILYAESECRFEGIEIEEGECRLEAWVEIDGKKNGFRFIKIERL